MPLQKKTKKKVKAISKFETIKVNREIKARVESEKKNQFMPISTFYDEAALAKLKMEADAAQ